MTNAVIDPVQEIVTDRKPLKLRDHLLHSQWPDEIVIEIQRSEFLQIVDFLVVLVKCVPLAWHWSDFETSRVPRWSYIVAQGCSEMPWVLGPLPYRWVWDQPVQLAVSDPDRVRIRPTAHRIWNAPTQQTSDYRLKSLTFIKYHLRFYALFCLACSRSLKCSCYWMAIKCLSTTTSLTRLFFMLLNEIFDGCY